MTGAHVLYAPDGRIVCPACFGKLDLATGTPARWRGLAIAGAIAGVVPFGISMSSSSSVMVNGEVTSLVYRDWIAVIGGVIAVLLGGATLWAARRENLSRLVAFAAGIGVLALGGVQIARGFGVFAQGGGNESHTSISITERIPAPPVVPKGDPNKPDTCPDDDACFNLGKKLEKANDFTNATIAYARSCVQGARGGCFNAGFLSAHRDKPEWENAVVQFQKGCDLGDLGSCNEVALAYKAGRGVAKDPARAKLLLEKGCAGDHPLSCVNLADLYDAGIAVDKDPKKAFELFTKGCDLGNDADTVNGCDRAGGHLYQGDGVKIDKRRAAGYMEKACARSDAYCYNLGVLTEHGEGIPKNLKQARVLYDRSCKAGKPDACNNLGHLLGTGLGGPKDKAAAKALYEKACSDGVTMACDNLKIVK